jgi:hypothetical protein
VKSPFGHPTFHILQGIHVCTTDSRTVFGQRRVIFRRPAHRSTIHDCQTESASATQERAEPLRIGPTKAASSLRQPAIIGARGLAACGASPDDDRPTKAVASPCENELVPSWRKVTVSHSATISEFSSCSHSLVRLSLVHPASLQRPLQFAPFGGLDCVWLLIPTTDDHHAPDQRSSFKSARHPQLRRGDRCAPDQAVRKQESGGSRWKQL